MDAHRADASRLAGLTLAGIGFAHFTNPRLFTPSTTRRASQRRARLRTYATGIVETMVGLGITNAATAKCSFASRCIVCPRDWIRRVVPTDQTFLRGVDLRAR
jgi:uncharacterized membrane protein